MRIRLLVLATSIACLPCMTLASEYTFDPSMLGISEKDMDMNLVNQGGQLPGVYLVDIYLNGERVDFRDITFTHNNDADSGTYLTPCLSVKTLSSYGVSVDKYFDAETQGEQCANLSAIPDIKVNYQFYNQQLMLSIPQISLRVKAQGIAPQTLWNDGIPALLLNYSANMTRTENREGNNNGGNNSFYVQLNPGINFGAWRLRSQNNWQKQGDEKGEWQTVYTYAERGLYNIKSRFVLGDKMTSDDVFDSVPFRGVMLGTDDNMVPYNQREYTPIIRGIARTQARVEVKQNGYTVYSQTVAPGPFALTDLNLSRGSGDLQVTVWEMDGNPQVFILPYQTPAIALHEGYLKYNVMMGSYRPSNLGGNDIVMQGTLMYGLPWNLTVFGGGQRAKHYNAMSLGLGVSLGAWGAISVDGTGSNAQRRGQDTESGVAWRVRYNKEIASTLTTLIMSRYQFSSEKYNTLSDVLDTWGQLDAQDNWSELNLNARKKSTTSLSLNQSLGEWGQLTIDAQRGDYWNREDHDDSYGVSYSAGVNNVSVTLSLSKNKQLNSNNKSSNDTVTSLYFSVPLERWLSSSGSSMRATYQLTSAQDSSNQQVGLNGLAFDRQLNWNVQQRFQSGDNVSTRNNGALNMNWYGRYGQVDGNYSYSPQQRQIGGRIAGGVVVHRNGITFGQTLGDTIALVEAPGATNVAVSGFPGVSTDFWGYTTKAYLTPYQENIISLDPTELPENVEIIQTDLRVFPTQGAVVPAKFATRLGARALMILRRAGGEVVPFGSVVSLSSGQETGIVGEQGQVYLTGLPPQGTLVVKWGDNKQCQVNYTLPDIEYPTPPISIVTIQEICQ